MGKVNKDLKAMSNLGNSHLCKLEKKFQQELETILKQEKLLWFQKLREEWIHLRDRNKKFYHAIIIIKNKRKKITWLKTENEEWLTENTMLEGMTQEYFQNLFKEEYTSNTVLPTHNNFLEILGEKTTVAPKTLL